LILISIEQIRVGMSVGHSPDIPQHEPDMPKKAENITAEEMQEAKRRIEGSLAPPPPGDLSQADDALQ
jgi:phosphatidylserine decarboxylase